LGGACSTYGRDEKYIENFSRKIRDYFGVPGIDGRIILK
jgi:hypothetical protein